MESSSEETSTPRRTPRQRASRAAVRAVRKPTERKVVPRREAPQKVEKEERVASPERKAPTPIAQGKFIKKKRQKQLITAGVLLAIGIGASAAIGFTDKGQIDVQKTIEERNQRIITNTTDNRDADKEIIGVPVQNTNNARKADGGLRGAGKKVVVPTPSPVVSSTTATSSDLTASSTDATASSTEDAVGEEETTTDSGV